MNTNHWTTLHQYPVEHAADWKRGEAIRWYKIWRRGIPRYTCKCQDNWDAYVAIPGNEPIFTSAREFFEWSVRAHNYVSENHAVPTKAPMTLLDAEMLYSVPWKE